MRQLVPLKILIGRKRGQRGRDENDYPDFNAISKEVRENLDWCHYIDRHGPGWQYSRDGFGEGDDPHHQWGAFAVPEPFAREALRLFGPGRQDGKPPTVFPMTAAEWEDFYDNDVHAMEEEEIIATEMVQGILARTQLEQIGAAPAPSESIRTLRNRRLDPNDELPGITRNKRRYWRWWKEQCKIEIKPIDPES